MRSLWRVLRILHGVAEAMELQHEREAEKHHRLVHGLQRDLAAEQRRVVQLTSSLEALSAAAAGAGLDVPAVLTSAVADADGLQAGRVQTTQQTPSPAPV